MKKSIPGLVKPLADYNGWRKSGGTKKTIEQKREGLVHSIERSLAGESRAPALEYLDPKLNVPVIRVLYASKPLPIFDGQSFAAIDSKCDRKKLWEAIVSEIRGGAFDREIEQASQMTYQSLKHRLKGPPRAV